MKTKYLLSIPTGYNKGPSRGVEPQLLDAKVHREARRSCCVVVATGRRCREPRSKFGRRQRKGPVTVLIDLLQWERSIDRDRLASYGTKNGTTINKDLLIVDRDTVSDYKDERYQDAVDYKTSSSAKASIT